MGMQGLNLETCSVVALPKLKVVPDLSVAQQTKAKLCCGAGVRRIPADEAQSFRAQFICLRLEDLNLRAVALITGLFAAPSLCVGELVMLRWGRARCILNLKLSLLLFLVSPSKDDSKDFLKREC